MKMKRVLLPTDFSTCANLALEHAIFHAEVHKADLHILHNYGWDYGETKQDMPNIDDLVPKMERAARAVVTNALDLHKDVPLRIFEKGTTRSSSAEAILDYAHENNMDLIVLGTHGRTGFHHFLVGSTAEMVVRLANCPILSVRAGGQRAELSAIRNIMVPIDFSAESAAALSIGREMAQFHHAGLIIFHVNGEDEEHNGKDKLIKFAAEAPGPHVREEFVIEDGPAAARICQAATNANTDLLVMGTHGRTGFRKAMLGSVTVQVVRNAPCPVLTLKKDMATSGLVL